MWKSLYHLNFKFLENQVYIWDLTQETPSLFTNRINSVKFLTYTYTNINKVIWWLQGSLWLNYRLSNKMLSAFATTYVSLHFKWEIFIYQILFHIVVYQMLYSYQEKYFHEIFIVCLFVNVPTWTSNIRHLVHGKKL